MAWLLLFLAGLMEIVWALALKASEGFTKPAPTALFVVGIIASVVLLGLAIRQLPIGTAYAIWTGIGTLGTVLLGIWIFQEPATLLRLSCIGFILLGIAGLKISESHPKVTATQAVLTQTSPPHPLKTIPSSNHLATQSFSAPESQPTQSP
jgi:quaternary ammonium compound-resistance protein SugE